MRILGDLPTYIQFKLYAKVDKEFQIILKDKLLELSDSKVNLDRYDGIVKERRSRSYRVSTQEFLKEIDAMLEAQLNPPQLQLI